MFQPSALGEGTGDRPLHVVDQNPRISNCVVVEVLNHQVEDASVPVSDLLGFNRDKPPIPRKQVIATLNVLRRYPSAIHGRVFVCGAPSFGRRPHFERLASDDPVRMRRR